MHSWGYIYPDNPNLLEQKDWVSLLSVLRF